ncbi:TetR family transcriptional regulator [Ignatzschineria ureiclastica]|uniref:TetR family transcriptional regulator n=1 Tax=Ignatzschineria ureiclastica TaxID=472582 RepID=A0A2U2AFE9_9GAMM|nr:TetR/AcrR family transcriptional regulator [Ignatzschineria ureiclastica]PWD81370.1 TetR family transcriptional regulator [Ignatzschineria ureiclastica]GGZ98350.1 TetR family transcriptional regulator [Ignatzschineria ureiclastica]
MTTKKETYTKIIQAASTCFARDGFNATSIRQIATEADISQGSMYTYFSGKTELIKAIVQEETATGLAKYHTQKQGSSFEKLCSIVISCIKEVAYPVNHDLWVEILAESSRNEELRAIFLEGDAQIRAGIFDLLEEGKENGEFNKSLDSESMTFFLIAIIDGLIARKALCKNFSVEDDLPEVRAYIQKILC